MACIPYSGTKTFNTINILIFFFFFFTVRFNNLTTSLISSWVSSHSKQKTRNILRRLSDRVQPNGFV